VKRRLIDRLACPVCRAALQLDAGDGGEDIREGRLRCGGCAATYPVTSGVPRLLPPDLGADAARTAERFGWEWQRFDEIRPEYETQFRGWITPLGPESFAGRRVLDGGCGKGRHLRLAARWGARDVVGLDLGPAVDVAARNTADLDNVHVVQGDLTRPPFTPGSFDLVYSIGVLHHLTEPDAGFRALAPLVAPGGTFAAWVYAREGNGMLLAFLTPARRLTRKAPTGLVSALAWALTVPLWAALRLLYRPARSRPTLAASLPYRGYLLDLTAFPFREVHSIVFDQLMAPIAHYMRREDVERCFRAARLTQVGLRWHHANSWAAFGAPRSD
jgi:SAM-dependent methyltransferase